jgi:rhamnosyl/mannosyltransferase
MKILQISKLYYPHVGGVEKIAQQISESLKENFKISVLCCRKKGKHKKENINGVEVIKASSLGMFWGMPLSFSFLKILKKIVNDFDIIDYHYPFPLADLAIYLFKPKNKLIVHYHSDIVRQKLLNFLIKPLTLNTLRRADKIIVSNPNIIETSPYLKKFKDKCEVIPFGVDIEKFQVIERKKNQKIKTKYGDFALFVGRLNYYKGVRYLIEAIEKVNLNLVIIPSTRNDPQRKLLEKRVEELNLKNKVFFIDGVQGDDLIKFYQTCKLFVLPSIFKSEAFGIVLIEAMACGKPLISTELGTGTSYVNKNKTTGYVVKPKDSKVIARAIQEIIQNQEKYQQMCLNSLKRSKEKFSLDEMIAKTKELYLNEI